MFVALLRSITKSIVLGAFDALVIIDPTIAAAAQQAASSNNP